MENYTVDLMPNHYVTQIDNLLFPSTCCGNDIRDLCAAIGCSQTDVDYIYSKEQPFKEFIRLWYERENEKASVTRLIEILNGINRPDVAKELEKIIKKGPSSIYTPPRSPYKLTEWKQCSENPNNALLLNKFMNKLKDLNLSVEANSLSVHSNENTVLKMVEVADFVVFICNPLLKESEEKMLENKYVPDKMKELIIALKQMVRDIFEKRLTSKYIPVLFPHCIPNDVPGLLKSSHHYKYPEEFQRMSARIQS